VIAGEVEITSQITCTRMGIDVYARFEASEGKRRRKWLSELEDYAGYLREAYHGEPYATRHLVPEAFECPDGAKIPAAVLRERLPETLRIAEVRARSVYGATSMAEVEPTLQQFRSFVELCERMERDHGVTVRIVASW
jgi:hypothetical protein